MNKASPTGRNWAIAMKLFLYVCTLRLRQLAGNVGAVLIERASARQPIARVLLDPFPQATFHSASHIHYCCRAMPTTVQPNGLQAFQFGHIVSLLFPRTQLPLFALTDLESSFCHLPILLHMLPSPLSP